ncbi:MAG: hypothetical protein ABTQ34_04805 [Bdellovibrionales bacterium]
MYAYYAGCGKPYLLSQTKIEKADNHGLRRIMGVGTSKGQFLLFSDPEGLPGQGNRIDGAAEVKLQGLFPEQVALPATAPRSDATLCYYQVYDPMNNVIKTYTTTAITCLKLENDNNKWIVAEGVGVENWKPKQQPPTSEQTTQSLSTTTSAWRIVLQAITRSGRGRGSDSSKTKSHIAKLVP